MVQVIKCLSVMFPIPGPLWAKHNWDEYQQRPSIKRENQSKMHQKSIEAPCSKSDWRVEVVKKLLTWILKILESKHSLLTYNRFPCIHGQKNTLSQHYLCLKWFDKAFGLSKLLSESLLCSHWSDLLPCCDWSTAYSMCWK